MVELSDYWDDSSMAKNDGLKIRKYGFDSRSSHFCPYGVMV